MIDRLRAAGDQLRVALDNYFHVYSQFQKDCVRIKASGGGTLPLEIVQQLDTELGFISSYEPRIQQIRSVISSTRNYSSGIAPINTLPPEILTRIFHLTSPSDCGLHILCYDEMQYSRHPDYLAEVCTLWRRVAISAHILWVHIDLVPHQRYSKRLVNRAQTHVARSGKLPIQLHISSDDNFSFEYYGLYDFLQSISRRVESLELRVDGPFRGFHRGLFGALLHDHPTLTKLVLNSQGPYFNNFLVSDTYDPVGQEEGCWPLVLDCTKDDLENGFASLSVLESRGIFPLWTSTAYHGLADLRLLSTSEWSHIREEELISVLSSSPRLRVLHFGLEIHDRVNRGAVVPVSLKDLQVVRIFAEDCKADYLSPGSILRLLAPGSKPLRLCLSGHYSPEVDTIMELDSFFARSRVSRFHAQNTFPPLSLLLRQAAHIECVVLEGIGYDNYLDPPATWLEINQYALSPRLKSLDIFDSILSERELGLLVESCPSGTTLHSSTIGRVFRLLSPHELAERFTNVVVKGIFGAPSSNPTADWDILDSD